MSEYKVSNRQVIEMNLKGSSLLLEQKQAEISIDFSLQSFFLLLPIIEVIGFHSVDRKDNTIIIGGKTDLFIYGFYNLFKNELELELNLKDKKINEKTFNTILLGYSVYSKIRNSLLHALGIGIDIDPKKKEVLRKMTLKGPDGFEFKGKKCFDVIDVNLTFDDSDFSNSPARITLGAKHILEVISNYPLGELEERNVIIVNTEGSVAVSGTGEYSSVDI